MSIAACIIAGGRSSRMGRDKALIELAGRPVMQWVIDRLAPQAAALAINANDGRFNPSNLPVIGDLRQDIGTPLAGLHAGLTWAAGLGAEALVTAPCDSPFLPRDLVKRLSDVEGPAIAAFRGQHHYLTGLWPCRLLPALEASSPGRVQDWVKHCGARIVDWSGDFYDPFFNINTPADLAEAERLAADFNP